MQDVWLGYFKKTDVVYNVKNLKSGDLLKGSLFDEALFLDMEGHPIVKLSRKYQQKLNSYFEKGYQLDAVYVKYIVIWYDEESGTAYRVVLPELEMKKM